jgi:hypothetical protein
MTSWPTSWRDQAPYITAYTRFHSPGRDDHDHGTVTAPPQPSIDAADPSPVTARASWPESDLVMWLLRALSVVAIALVVSTGHARIDREEVAVPTYAIASGHPGAAYPPIAPSLSQRVAYQPPGFPVVAAIPVAVWQGLTGGADPSGALTFAGYGAAAVVVVAGGRLVGASPGGRRRERLFLAAVSVSPFFREALGNYFHPEDVLALGLLLLSLSLASEGRWGWAGGALGLAFGSKQWALLALPPLIAMAPGRREMARLAGIAFGTVAVVYAPFILLTPAAAWQVLRGPIPVAGGFVPETTMVGMLREAPFHVPLTYVNDMARLLPLLFATVGTAIWVLVASRRQRAVARLPLGQVVTLLLACMAFRLIGDCIALPYYALPLMVFIAVADVWRSKVPAFAIAAGFVLAFWYGAGPGDRLGPWAGAIVFTAGVVVVAAVGLLTLRPAPGPRLPPGDPMPVGVASRVD